VINATRKVHDFLTVGAAAPLQEAAVTALKFQDSYYKELAASYTLKRELFLKGLSNAGLSYATPQGAYYVLVDISEFKTGSDMEFCEWMARKVGVAAVPGSSFFNEKNDSYIRFHFAKKEKTLGDACDRLLNLRSFLPGTGKLF
jgi:L-glutamine---4-(methylsulfanyl)-2-oxobutanoate aminotransferase